MNDPIQLVPTKPDAEVAAELKNELIKAYGPVLTVLDKIVAAGFQANVNTGPLLGKQAIINLQIVKIY